MKHIILANTNVPLYSFARDLRGGGSFKSTFLRRFFLNLTVKKFQNCITFVDVLPFGTRGSVNYDSPCICI